MSTRSESLERPGADVIGSHDGNNIPYVIPSVKCEKQSDMEDTEFVDINAYCTTVYCDGPVTTEDTTVGLLRVDEGDDGFGNSLAAPSSVGEDDYCGSIPEHLEFPPDSELSRCLQRGLKEKSLHPTMRCELVRVIARTALRCKRNGYRQRDYERLASLAVQRWKQLETTAKDGQLALRKAISKRVRYLKGRQNSNVANSSRESNRGRIMLPREHEELAESLPAAGTDNTALEEDEKLKHERRVENMQQDLQKLPMGTLSSLMKETYPVRRREVLDGTLPAAELRRRYPALEIEPLVLEEFTRVLGKKEVFLSQIRCNWNNILDKLLDAARMEKIVAVQKEFKLYNNTVNTDDQKSRLALRILPLMLPYRGQSNRWTYPRDNYIYQEFAEGWNADVAALSLAERNSPFIMNVSNKLVIATERKPYLIVNGDIVDALTLLFATYFVYSIEYPAEAGGAYLLLQHVFLGMKQPSSCQGKLQQKLTYLKEYLS